MWGYRRTAESKVGASIRCGLPDDAAGVWRRGKNQARAARMQPNKPADVWTIGKVVRWATEDFSARGIESPRLEADLLLGFCLGIDRIKIITDPDRPLAPNELAKFKALVLRRRNHEPLAYIRGTREFFGREFRVDNRVLIPRPDTETLVETALRRTQLLTMFATVLDLCTGSGCVATTIARERRTWRVDGSDVSPDAIAVARANAHRLGAIWNVRWVVSDLFSSLDPTRDQYDLITANPPYIPSAEVQTLPAHIRDFEPQLALDGGPQGLDLIKRIVSESRRFLVPDGILAMEIMVGQGEIVRNLMQKAGFTEVLIDQDYGNRERVVSGKWTQ